MNNVVNHVTELLASSNLSFAKKPILIGGMAMEFYEMRKAGADIDLIITDDDYQILAEKYSNDRKDLYGDLGIVTGKFEIWRSIAHLDYDFFKKDAIEKENILIVSIDRLLWTRVCAMEEEKYRNDLKLLKEYYYKNYTNPKYHQEALSHEKSYLKMNGAVFAGKYDD
jgi:predicted nuclease with TOPRIM domain